MGYLFVIEGIDPSITAVDSTMMKAKDSVWYKSSMDKGGVPSCPPGMDTDAKWGYNHTKKGWIFGYKLYLTCTEAIYELVVPLTTDVTTAHVPDKRCIFLYHYICILFTICVIISHEPDYDDKNLYEYGKKVLGIDLICPVERYENTSKKRLELVCFYEWYWDRLSISKEEYL